MPAIVLKLARNGSVVTKKLNGCIDISDERKRVWSIQLAEAVAYIHGRNLIRRHIKPSNVLVGDCADIKLVSGQARSLVCYPCMRAAITEMSLLPCASLTLCTAARRTSAKRLLGERCCSRRWRISRWYKRAGEKYLWRRAGWCLHALTTPSFRRFSCRACLRAD